MSTYRGSGRSDYDDGYERRSARRSPPRRAAVREYEDVDVRVRERDRSRERVDRTPAFLREDNRRTEAGALVLRAREVETIDRRRVPSPSPPPQVRSRSIRPRYVQRDPSPSVNVDVDIDTRVIERRRPRSPTPEREREVDVDLRIVHREKERAPTPQPSPPPPPPEPPVIRGPTIEREVITHYRDIDHGVIRVRQPSPSPPPPPAPRQRVTQHETDIDINISRHETDVDVRQRARSRSRPATRAQSRPRPRFYEEDDIHIDIDHNRVRIDESTSETRRRAHSEVRRPAYDDEANYITSKIDSRGRMGEAWNGATKDWTIVDVPPGTERVQMDGVGGGGAEVTWQRYNGVRRAKFVPERDGTVVSSNSTSVSDRGRDLDQHAHHHDHELSVDVHIGGKNQGRERSRSRGGELVEEIRDRRISIRDGKQSSKRDSDMWTEITKDLVIREAIEKRGYQYEETEFFFYVMQYLAYEDVLELVEISDRIRRRRRDKDRYQDWERDAYRDDWDRKSRHYHSHSTYGGPRSSHWEKYDNERVREHDVTYERLRY